jgi:hypothetical protein
MQHDDEEKITKAPIGRVALSKNRIFGGHIDQQKIEKKDQKSTFSDLHNIDIT